MNTSLRPIDERKRIAAPGPSPMALAYENGNLWSVSAEDWTVRGFRLSDGSRLHEVKAPAKPFGGVLVGNTFRIICGDGDDNRSIHDYVLGKEFTPGSMRCPNDTGNFLARDARALYVSQRFDQLFIEVNASGEAVRTIPMPRQVVGAVAVGDAFYLLTTDGDRLDTDIRLAKMLLHDDKAAITELAHVPFGARSLAYDGTGFWTSWREKDLIVSFALPS